MFPQASFAGFRYPHAERLGSSLAVHNVAMLRWFHALMPKEERFFALFARHSDAVLAGAEALRSMRRGAAVKANYQTVMDRQHDADDVTREVLIAVRAPSSRRSIEAISVT
jgi:uncharacterized protein Yka (UPF0111/DUF47 family)